MCETPNPPAATVCRACETAKPVPVAVPVASGVQLGVLPDGVDPVWFIELPPRMQQDILDEHAMQVVLDEHAMKASTRPSSRPTPTPTLTPTPSQSTVTSAARAHTRGGSRGSSGNTPTSPHNNGATRPGANTNGATRPGPHSNGAARPDPHSNGAARPNVGSNGAAGSSSHSNRVGMAEGLGTMERNDRNRARDLMQRIYLDCASEFGFGINKYEDASFPPTQESISAGGRKETSGAAIKWERPEGIMIKNTSALAYDRNTAKPDWVLWLDPGPSDVIQGSLGDCWFLSAVAAVAERPALLRNVFVTKDTSPTGAYQIRLCMAGKWRIYTIDDNLPCTVRGNLAFSDGARGQLWAPLLEKAMAKAHGSYRELSLGHLEEAMETLTGQPTEVFRFRQTDPDTGDVCDPDVAKIWAKVLSSRQADFLMGASTGASTDAEKAAADAMGLSYNHAYSVLDCLDVDDDVSGLGALRLMLIRNPHGQSSKTWSGAWSKTSAEWTPSMQAILQPIEDTHCSASAGGVFFMAFDDFCRYFTSLTICKVRSDWTEVRSRVLLPSTTPGQDVVGLRLRALASCGAEIVITQQGKRGLWTHETFLDLGCLVVKVRGTSETIVGAAACADVCSVQCEAAFESHEDSGAEYLILPFSPRALTELSSQERRMVVAVHSATPVLVDEEEMPISVFQRAMLKHVRRSGVTFGGHLGCTLYKLNGGRGSVVLVADNRTKTRVSVTLTITQKNMVSSRGELTTADVVLAGHGQILGMLTTATEGSGYRYSIQPSFRGATDGTPHTPPVPDNSIHACFKETSF